MTPDILVRSWPNVAANQCAFYHTMDLPDGSTVNGQWDLRGRMPEYIGGVDVAGKRVLDVGCASGFLSFEMERLGAREVISFDADHAERIAFLPVHDIKHMTHPGEWRRDNDQFLERLRNSYWYSHRLLKSKAACYYGDVYSLPSALGTFDVVVMGQILIHLRDPIAAIASVAQRCHDTLVIVEGTEDSPLPIAQLMGSRDRPYIFWRLSVALYRTLLGFCGFTLISAKSAKYTCAVLQPNEVTVTTIVAKRNITAPVAAL